MADSIEMGYSFYVAEQFCCLDMTHFSPCSRPGTPLMQLSRFSTFLPPTTTSLPLHRPTATTTHLNYPSWTCFYCQTSTPLRCFRWFPLPCFSSFLQHVPPLLLIQILFFLYSFLPIRTDLPPSTIALFGPFFLFLFLFYFPLFFLHFTSSSLSVSNYLLRFSLSYPFASLLHSLPCYRVPSPVSFFYHLLLHFSAFLRQFLPLQSLAPTILFL